MPRKVISPSCLHPYHVTARALNREPFPIPLEMMWRVFEDYLFLTTRLYSLEVTSFVMMPNHFHMLVRTPNANLGPAMNFFMREVARETSRLSGRINQTFGARHHRTLIHDAQYFQDAYKYVYRNPVRAGIVRRVEDYKFSTLHGILGSRGLLIPIAEDTMLFNDEFDEATLRWLNENPKEGLEDEVRQALRHAEYAVNTSRKTNRPSALLTERL